MLANMDEKSYAWTFKFCKIVQQQIESETLDFIPASSYLLSL